MEIIGYILEVIILNVILSLNMIIAVSIIAKTFPDKIRMRIMTIGIAIAICFNIALTMFIISAGDKSMP